MFTFSDKLLEKVTQEDFFRFWQHLPKIRFGRIFGRILGQKRFWSITTYQLRLPTRIEFLTAKGGPNNHFLSSCYSELIFRGWHYTSSPFISYPVISSRSFRPLIHFVPGHFVPGHFVPWSFRPLVILSRRA
jgi:hypothetical protein